MIWMQVLSALAIVMMLVFLYPSAKHWLENSPKAEKGDWQAVLLPLALVAGFILLLVSILKA